MHSTTRPATPPALTNSTPPSDVEAGADSEALLAPRPTVWRVTIYERTSAGRQLGESKGLSLSQVGYVCVNWLLFYRHTEPRDVHLIVTPDESAL